MAKVFFTILLVFLFNLPVSAQTLLTEKDFLFADDMAKYYIDPLNYECMLRYDNTYIYSFNIAVEIKEQAIDRFLQQNPKLPTIAQIQQPLLPSEQDNFKLLNIYFVGISADNLHYIPSGTLAFGLPAINSKMFSYRDLKLPQADYQLIIQKAIEYINKQQLTQADTNLKLFKQSAYSSVYLDLNSYQQNIVTINNSTATIHSIAVTEYYPPLGVQQYVNYQKTLNNYLPQHSQLQKRTYTLHKDETKYEFLITDTTYYYNNGQIETIADNNNWQSLFSFDPTLLMSRMPTIFDRLRVCYQNDSNYLFVTNRQQADIALQISFGYLFKNKAGEI